MLNIDLTGKRALVAGVADDAGFGFAIAKALAEAGASVSVGTWPPALNIFMNLLERGKMDESRKLSSDKLLQFEKIYPLDASFDTLADAPEDIRSNKRYKDTGDFSIDGMVKRIESDFGQSSLDIVVHSLANGPEVKKPLLETSRSGYLTALSVSAYFRDMVVACRRQKRRSRAIRVFCLLRPVANTACASTRFQRDRWPPVQQARLESSRKWSSTAPTTLLCQNRYRRRKLETQRRSSRVRSLLELPAPCFTSTRDTMRWGWRFKRRHPKTDSQLRIFFGGCRCFFPLDPDFDFLKTRHRHPTAKCQRSSRDRVIPAYRVGCAHHFEGGGRRRGGYSAGG